MDFNEFKKIPFGKRTRCAVCQEELNKPQIELPKLPLTEIYTSENLKETVGFVDQNFHLCKECGHGQLSNIISPDILYGRAYSFRTSKSLTSVKGNDVFSSFIDKIIKNRKFKAILEIGCNDLYLLNSLKSKAEKLVGIDPILKGREEELLEDKIIALGDFFENVDLNHDIDLDDALVLSSHNLEHIEDPRMMIKKLLDNADSKTLFIFQFPGLETLVEDCRFDQVFHHHLHYFSIYSFTYLLNELGGELIDFKVSRHFWGSLLVAFRKGSKKNVNPLSEIDTEKISPEKILKHYGMFSKKMNSTHEYLESLRGEKIYGYGAALTLPVLGYHLKTDFSDLDCVIDDDKNKDGLFYINLSVPIKTLKNIDNLEDSTIIVTAINNSRQILPKLIQLNPKRIILLLSNI